MKVPERIQNRCRLSFAPESPTVETPMIPVSPLLVVIIGNTAERVRSAVSLENGPENSGIKPVAFAAMRSEESSDERGWTKLLEAMGECVTKMGLDPTHCYDLAWDVLLVVDHTFEIDHLRTQLEWWATRTRWPLRFTMFVDASTYCLPWSQLSERQASRSGLDVLQQLSTEAREAIDQRRPMFTWNGSYLFGMGNRFGFLRAEDSVLLAARLISVCATSRLEDWLATLPDRMIDDPESGACDSATVSCIGVSSFWDPGTDWQRVYCRIRAFHACRLHTQCRAGENYSLMHSLGEYCYDSAYAQLSSHHSIRIQSFLACSSPDPIRQCGELVDTVTERESRFFDAVRPFLRTDETRFLERLQRELDAIGRALVQSGRATVFDACLDSVETSLEKMERDAREHLEERYTAIRDVRQRLVEIMTPVRKGELILAHPRSRYFIVRWWQHWKLHRWYARAVDCTNQVLHAELCAAIDRSIIAIAQAGQRRVQEQRHSLRLYQARLQRACANLEKDARVSLEPPLRTDVASVDFESVERWIVSHSPRRLNQHRYDLNNPSELSDYPEHWHQWERKHFEGAFLALAEQKVEVVKGMHSSLPELGSLDSSSVLQALSDRSQPLLPVDPFSFEAFSHHMHQRWLIPRTQSLQLGILSHGGVSIPTTFPWPSVITVYRELPVKALRTTQTQSNA